MTVLFCGRYHVIVDFHPAIAGSVSLRLIALTMNEDFRHHVMSSPPQADFFFSS
jgi:hypothetical protein